MDGDDTDTPRLSVEELAFVDMHGGVSGAAGTSSRRSVRQCGATAEDPPATAAQLASLLGLTAEEIRRGLRERDLYVHPAAGPGAEPRFPLWQFRTGRPVPHLAEILAALPKGFTYAEVRAFALHAEVDEPSGDATVPLLDWLAAGGDPGPALEVAADQAWVI